MTKFKYIIAILTLVACVLSSCSSIDCSLESKVLCNITLQDSEGNNIEMKRPLTVVLNRTATESDTVYINQMEKVRSFSVPMSYDAATDNITVKVSLEDGTELTDVISLSKTNTAVFESVDCQPRYHHELTEATTTHNLIESIIINNPKVSNDATVCNIYIRLITGD